MTEIIRSVEGGCRSTSSFPISESKKGQNIVNVEMKKLSSVVFQLVAALALIDLAILVTALLQVSNGQGGYFAPFWRVQAEFIFNLLS